MLARAHRARLPDPCACASRIRERIALEDRGHGTDLCTMSYKTIMVHLDAGRRRRERLDLAFNLAERFDAHLVGFFGLEVLLMPTVPEAGAAPHPDTSKSPPSPPG